MKKLALAALLVPSIASAQAPEESSIKILAASMALIKMDNRYRETFADMDCHEYLNIMTPNNGQAEAQLQMTAYIYGRTAGIEAIDTPNASTYIICSKFPELTIDEVMLKLGETPVRAE